MKRTKEEHAISVNDFKEVMRKGMIENFKRDGCLSPVVFFYIKDEIPQIGIIPKNMLESTASKASFALNIKTLCIDPNVLAVGIIVEAYSAKIDENSNNAQKLLTGELSLRDSSIEKRDVITMIFSTPEKDESIVYSVDCEKKTVGEVFSPEGTESMGSIFGNFFELRK